MTKLVHAYSQRLPRDARHVVYANDETLGFITATADVWTVGTAQATQPAELVISGEQLLAPLAKELGKRTIRPAAGNYPRLALALSTNTIIVNTHDLVLVGHRLTGHDEPRVLSRCWGQYYPTLEFSPDERYFLAKADDGLVFATEHWHGLHLDGIDGCAWHPTDSALLCLSVSGKVFWTRILAAGVPPMDEGLSSSTEVLGSIGVRNGANQVAGLVILPGATDCIVAFHPPCVEQWQLNPLRQVGKRDLDDGEIVDLRLSPDGRWLAVHSTRGLRISNSSEPLAVSKLFRGIDSFDFSPSGESLLTVDAPRTVSTWHLVSDTPGLEG